MRPILRYLYYRYARKYGATNARGALLWHLHRYYVEPFKGAWARLIHHFVSRSPPPDNPLRIIHGRWSNSFERAFLNPRYYTKDYFNNVAETPVPLASASTKKSHSAPRRKQLTGRNKSLQYAYLSKHKYI